MSQQSHEMLRVSLIGVGSKHLGIQALGGRIFAPLLMTHSTPDQRAQCLVSWIGMHHSGWFGRLAGGQGIQQRLEMPFIVSPTTYGASVERLPCLPDTSSSDVVGQCLELKADGLPSQAESCEQAASLIFLMCHQLFIYDGIQHPLRQYPLPMLHYFT